MSEFISRDYICNSYVQDDEEIVLTKTDVISGTVIGLRFYKKFFDKKVSVTLEEWHQKIDGQNELRDIFSLLSNILIVTDQKIYLTEKETKIIHADVANIIVTMRKKIWPDLSVIGRWHA